MHFFSAVCLYRNKFWSKATYYSSLKFSVEYYVKLMTTNMCTAHLQRAVIYSWTEKMQHLDAISLWIKASAKCIYVKVNYSIYYEACYFSDYRSLSQCKELIQKSSVFCIINKTGDWRRESLFSACFQLDIWDCMEMIWRNITIEQKSKAPEQTEASPLSSPLSHY